MNRILLRVAAGLSVFCLIGLGVVVAKASDISLAEDYYLKGQEFMAQGNYEMANESFLRAQQVLDSDSSAQSLPEVRDEEPVLSALGANTYLLNSKDGAIIFYKQALEKYPENYDICYNLAVVYLKNEDYEHAIEYFKKVVSRNKKDADAYYNLGVIYESIFNNYVQAAEYYQKYLGCTHDKREKRLVESWVEYMQRSNWSRAGLK